MTKADPPRLNAIPLATWERDGIKAVLRKAGLPSADVESSVLHFWRFETEDLTPVGFGGIEIHGEHALLYAVVTLPPLRHRGIGSAIVAALETEARNVGCRGMWLMTNEAAQLFGRLGYVACERTSVPAPIRQTQQFVALAPTDAAVMTKSLQ